MKTLMTYEDFLKGVKTVCFGICTPKDNRGESISITWVTGGMSGGSCWGKEPTPDFDCIEPEPEFQELDEILSLFAPNISYLQYKRLLANIVDTSSDYDCGYYGNTTNYAKKTIYLKQLYNELVVLCDWDTEPEKKEEAPITLEDVKMTKEIRKRMQDGE